MSSKRARGRKMTAKQLAEAKALAERLKKYPHITNPHALARWMVLRGVRVRNGLIREKYAKIIRERRARRMHG